MSSDSLAPYSITKLPMYVKNRQENWHQLFVEEEIIDKDFI